MAIISRDLKQYAELYTGYDSQQVGLGLQTGIYATPAYARKKIQTLMIGAVSRIVYSPFEHDQSPLIVPIFYESQYNTIMAFNLHYLPIKHRQAIMKFILDSNIARIKGNQPLVLDWHSIVRKVPDARYVTRRYKTLGTRVVETIPLIEVPEVIKEPSKWSRHYLYYKNQSKKK